MSVITGGAGGTSIAQTSVDLPRIYGMWLVDVTEVSNIGLSSLVSNWSTSGVSGPASDPIDPGYLGISAGATQLVSAAGGLNTSFDATSAYIGNSYAVYLNYPYVTGVEDPIGTGTT